MSNYKSGFIAIVGKTQCRKINIVECIVKRKNRNHVGQTEYDKKQYFGYFDK